VQVLEYTGTTPRKLDQVVTLVISKQEAPGLNIGGSIHCHGVFLGFIQFSLYSSAIVPEIVPRKFFFPTSRVVGYYYHLIIRCIIVRLMTALLNREHKEIRT
jgi:hypothetical protein